MPRLTDEQEEALTERAVQHLRALAQAASQDPAMQDTVTIGFTGRGWDGRFETLLRTSGLRWQAMLDVIEQAMVDFDRHPDRYLDDDVDSLDYAFRLVEVLMETAGNGYYVVIQPVVRRRKVRV